MRIAYVFDMEIAADARTQKEIDAFARAGAQVRILEWNKDGRYPLKRKTLRIRGRETVLESVGIPVRKAEGISLTDFRHPDLPIVGEHPRTIEAGQGQRDINMPETALCQQANRSSDVVVCYIASEIFSCRGDLHGMGQQRCNNK